uniref:Uncharacterized protein n=1 Tax=Astatotilapia calliptera TaxID=8154 RepID=A0A3P8NYM5_ASTCA
MVELICAPKIHHDQIAYLKIITEEYVHSRHTIFPNHPLKPKHHYLLHYSDLFLHFGPLIRLWTLRFESKHSYFKECARKLHNFVHLCKTLAERHQLLQAYLSSGPLFAPAVQAVGETSEYDEQLYNGLIQESVRTADMDSGSLHHEINLALPDLHEETKRAVIEHLTDIIGVRNREDLLFVEPDDIKPFLTPIQSRRLVQVFRKASGQLPSTQPNVSNTSWISNFSVPWEKMPTRLSQALATGGMAHPEDRRIMIRTVVEGMRVHCPNPNRAACGEVARAIVSKYPATFADKTAEGEQLGCGYYSLLKQLKTRVEHVNRDNVSSRIRQPRKRSTRENNEGDVAIKRGRSELDSYGCINWQPTTLPEGETSETLETKRQTMSTVFRSAGPQAIETTDVNTYMSLTYIYQRHMLNSWPAPTLCEVQEHWPFLFTKRGLCTHFHTLTDIEVETRLSEALLTKGRRILNFFQSQRLQWNKEIEHLLRECDSAKLNHNQIATAAILLLMKYFQEKEDSIFILADAFSTKMSVEREMTLPITPRVIALGNNFMSASRWMISLEGKVFYEPEQMHDFASTLAVFFASYYVFNLEYQESASITLEMIQRFFVRINPDMGTKCPAKLGTSRKTGRVVKRKVTSICPRITTFLQRLSEFEWRTSN